MTPLTEAQRKKAEELAEEQGNRHANPIIRSMYPLTSRGEMAKQFAQLFSLGFTAGIQHRDEPSAYIEALAQIANLEAALSRLTKCGPPSRSCTGEEVFQVMLEDNCRIASETLSSLAEWKKENLK